MHKGVGPIIQCLDCLECIQSPYNGVMIFCKCWKNKRKADNVGIGIDSVEYMCYKYKDKDTFEYLLDEDGKRIPDQLEDMTRIIGSNWRLIWEPDYDSKELDVTVLYKDQPDLESINVKS